MAAGALPLVIAGAALLFALVSSKKKTTATGGGSSGGTMTGGGGEAPPAECPTCFDAGMPPALAVDVANALANAAKMGPQALLEKAAAIASAGFPCAAACLKQTADAIAAGLPGATPTGIVLPGGGHPGHVVLADGTKVPIPDLSIFAGGGAAGGMALPSPGTPMAPSTPMGPTSLPSWCNPGLGICFAASSKMPPFNTAGVAEEFGGGHGHFPIRAGDLPNALAAYYTGDASRYVEMIPYNASSSSGQPIVTTAGKGPGWKVGESVTIPAAWNPYAKPKPVAGSTTTPLAPVQYPNLPSVPPVPFVDLTPAELTDLIQKLATSAGWASLGIGG